MRFEDQRELLIKDLSAAGITDSRVLEAFSIVPREDFVASQHREYSYHNRALPIADGQTISQPLMVAIMLQELQTKHEDIVLEVGTGSGYQTALLAHLVKEVCSIELLESLSLGAQKALRSLKLKNLHFRIGDGAAGWVGAYPPYNSFDKIIVSAGATRIPTKLTEQLAEGGIMVIPVGENGLQKLIRIERKNGTLVQTELGLCSFVPLVTKL